MTDYQTILVDIDNRGIANLTLNRPDKHNAMSSGMMQDILSATNTLNENNAVRGVIITGAGQSFCAGADLAWMRENFERNRNARIKESQALAEMLQALDQLKKPLIAKVNGQAYAGGIGLICACDIVIGIPEAKFSITEVKLGLIPANISHYLIRRIGMTNTRRCALNAHFFKGVEAKELGLLDKVVSADQLNTAVENEVLELLNCAPEAIARTKQLIQYVSTHDYENSKKITSEVLADCWEGEEAQRGISSFFAKESPPWKL